MSSKHLVHIDDVPAGHLSHGERFGATYRRLGQAAGGAKLGCSLYEIEPGRTAFPFHAHFGIEEAIYVLDGYGTLRLGDRELQVRPGSYAAFPADGETAHQLINTGEDTLRYLCLSTAADPELVVYPDSQKVGATAGGWPPKVRLLGRPGDNLGYYDGEE